MLHILWLAVKFIGMLLALILAVILLVVVLVLFCPLRYRVKIRKTVDEWEAHGRASWLFGLVSVTVRKGSAGADTQLRICGIRPGSVRKLFAGKRRSEKKRRKESLEPPGEPDRKLEVSKELEATEEREAAPAPVLAEIPKEKKKGTEPEPDSEASKSSKESFWERNPIRKLWVRIVEKYKSIRESLRNFQNTMKRMWQRLHLWKGFLGDAHTGETFRLARRQFFRLLRHAGPQKWEGSVNLGLEDPAATGQVLAVLGALYPMHRGKFLVNPVWDRKVLEGSARVKGRVYGFMLLYMAARLFFDKNVKYVIGWFRRQSGSGWNMSN